MVSSKEWVRSIDRWRRSHFCWLELMKLNHVKPCRENIMFSLATGRFNGRFFLALNFWRFRTCGGLEECWSPCGRAGEMLEVFQRCLWYSWFQTNYNGNIYIYIWIYIYMVLVFLYGLVYIYIHVTHRYIYIIKHGLVLAIMGGYPRLFMCVCDWKCLIVINDSWMIVNDEYD